MNDEDVRIVSMQFNNKEFERKIKQTMQSLSELESQLKIVGKETGLDEIPPQVEEVDDAVKTLSKEVSTAGESFNALSIMASQIFRSIAIDAYALGKNLVNYLNKPLNQIVEGGVARSQKIARAKFMFEGAAAQQANGVKDNIASWDDILQDINYGVQDTAYGLDAAANVASQLFASNVQIGDNMKTALRGISGVAAMTNSTYEEIGHVYTQVASQGRLMGMQVQMLSLRGMNVYATIAQYLRNVGEVADATEQTVKDMVSRGEIDFATFSAAMDEAFGEHAKKSNETFDGIMSNIRAALSKIGEPFATPFFDESIPVLNSVKDILSGIKIIAVDLASAWADVLGPAADYANLFLRDEKVVTNIFQLFKDIASWIKPVLYALEETLILPIQFGDAFHEAGDSVRSFLDSLYLSGDRAALLRDSVEVILGLIGTGIIAIKEILV
ncbi:MAG: hypothetical protein KBT27_03545, partial [Prevotellaceae bacterium]|nr:hypothetical protein [Candidatus Faecinaster equi]